MNIVFCGDSWLWTWKKPLDRNTENHNPEDYWHSKSMHQLSDIGISTLSLTTILLKQLGHNVSHICNPGKSFNKTFRDFNKARSIMPFGAQAKKPHVIVIWVASDLRGPTNVHPEWNLRDKNTFLQQYDNFVLSTLTHFNNEAKDGQHLQFVFVGGQSGLPKEVWDRIENLQPNMHLLSEHILNTLSIVNTEFGPLNFNRFYMENEFAKIYDECDHQSEVDPELVDYMANVSGLYNNPEFKEPDTVRMLTYPDHHHLGYAGQVYFVDYFLKYCEDRNWL